LGERDLIAVQLPLVRPGSGSLVGIQPLLVRELDLVLGHFVCPLDLLFAVQSDRELARAIELHRPAIVLRLFQGEGALRKVCGGGSAGRSDPQERRRGEHTDAAKVIHDEPPLLAERPSSAAGPAAKTSSLGKPSCRPRLLQRLVRRYPRTSQEDADKTLGISVIAPARPWAIPPAKILPVFSRRHP